MVDQFVKSVGNMLGGPLVRFLGLIGLMIEANIILCMHYAGRLSESIDISIDFYEPIVVLVTKRKSSCPQTAGGLLYRHH